MTVTIDKLYIKTFESNVIMKAQQKPSRLRNFVTEKKQQTSNNAFRLVGSLDMTQKSAGRTATPENDTPWSNRCATPATYHIGDTVEPEDEAQTNVSPGSSIVSVFAAAANRQIDDLIIAAASAAALKEDGTTDALPSDSKVGSATTEWTFDLVTEIIEKFLTWEYDPSERKVMVVSPNSVKKMLGWTEFTSSDFTNVKALQSGGFVPGWMGFDWVCSTRLANPAGLQRKNLAFTPASMGLLVAKDIWSEIGKDPSKSFMLRYYSALTMGAVRIQDKGVVEAHILES